ncbi:putative quinol monooxygenase [Saccharibacter floricola]|uniref:Antibiotic biosynthesis monooxygenase n=1 Tax=Saccharibacter floricola DSM 15669 TaxID=1123227 RepID=A0ABQ0NXM6_9PROT|nr:putative quinol monooxygenase [Saccharibacter floricola]GBQ05940.1 putative antibiotic biosynthesis monooxygenase [Saccharibacter floricola DSM 15669]
MSKNLYATMRALPECREKVASLLTALADNVRAEPGCVRFVVYSREDDPQSFHVEESYRDEDAFKAHMSTEHGKLFNKAIETLVEGGASQVVFLDTVG